MSDKQQVLDHGYVRLVDALGDDLSVVNAARVSFDKESQDLDDSDRKLLSYLARNNHTSPFRHATLTFEVYAPLMVARQWWKHCFSSDTEVFTDRGWIQWPEVTESDRIANVTEDGEMYFAEPIELISYYYKGDMVHLEHGKLDQMITPDHRIYAAKRNRTGPEEFKVYRAKELMQGEFKMPKLPVAAINEGSNEDYLEGQLHGFALAEGNFTATRNRCYIIVKKQRERELLSTLMKGVKADWRVHSDEEYIKVSFEKRGVMEGAYEEKQFGVDFSSTSLSYLRGILDGYAAGDGSENLNGTIRLATASPSIKDGLIRTATLLGIPTKTWILDGSRYTSRGNLDMYYITLQKNTYRHLHTGRREYVDYDGMVYCATVDTGMLLVRRNGKISVSGNCIGGDHTQQAYDPATAWNESSRRYVTEDVVLYTPDVLSQEPDNKKQGAGDEHPDSNVLLTRLKDHYDLSNALYSSLMASGVAPEQARLALPAYGMYVRWRWTTSLHAALHFLDLRNDAHAQQEIRAYAQAIDGMVADRYPACHTAWTEKDD